MPSMTPTVTLHDPAMRLLKNIGTHLQKCSPGLSETLAQDQLQTGDHLPYQNPKRIDIHCLCDRISRLFNVAVEEFWSHIAPCATLQENISSIKHLSLSMPCKLKLDAAAPLTMRAVKNYHQETLLNT